MPYANVVNYNDSRPVRFILDYDVRTDGQPVYQGFADTGVATSTPEWLIYKFSFNGSNQVTNRDVAYGSWDNRASLTYD